MGTYDSDGNYHDHSGLADVGCHDTVNDGQITWFYYRFWNMWNREITVSQEAEMERNAHV